MHFDVLLMYIILSGAATLHLTFTVVSSSVVGMLVTAAPDRHIRTVPCTYLPQPLAPKHTAHGTAPLLLWVAYRLPKPSDPRPSWKWVSQRESVSLKCRHTC